MFKFIDNFIDRITMYRLLLYYLIVLLVIAVVYSFLHILPYQPLALIFEIIFLISISWVSNKILAKIFNAPTNLESLYITALILALIITPPTVFTNVAGLFWAALLTMASKFIFNIRTKHIFNPVAVAVFLTSLVINQTASWWVGNAAMMPYVVIGGLLIVRKLRREDMVYTFILVALLTTFAFAVMKNSDIFTTFTQITLHSSLFFLAFAMLTEPYTMPPTKKMQIIYAIIVGFVFSPGVHLGSYYFAPEAAILLGNIFAYIVSPKEKFIVNLQEKIKLSLDQMDFLFSLPYRMHFLPGQYMEFTLQHEDPDSRGNRRYFTLANSPTENNMRLGVKFYENGSSFKRALINLDQSGRIVGAQLAGDFTLPVNRAKKLVFIAGGIGITPFRSMLKYLIDTGERRDIVLFYSNKRLEEIIYADIFTEAYQKLGIRTVYTLTDTAAIPPNWQGEQGRISAEMFSKYLPDYPERTYYLSGPHSMVEAFKDTLTKMGINRKQIVMDYFPGLV